MTRCGERGADVGRRGPWEIRPEAWASSDVGGRGWHAWWRGKTHLQSRAEGAKKSPSGWRRRGRSIGRSASPRRQSNGDDNRHDGGYDRGDADGTYGNRVGGADHSREQEGGSSPRGRQARFAASREDGTTRLADLRERGGYRMKFPATHAAHLQLSEKTRTRDRAKQLTSSGDGAEILITYHAKEAARWLREQ